MVVEQVMEVQLLEITLVEAVDGGAGAGIGGNGGSGGHANQVFIYDHGPYIVGDNSPCGEDGKAGENAGIINIFNDLKVYAYGGGGRFWRIF